jgi:hypothetical protein
MKVYTLHTRDPMGKDFAIVDEDGNKIENVVSFWVRGEAGALIEAELTIVPLAANMKVVVNSIEFICPNCGDSTSHTCESTLGNTS